MWRLLLLAVLFLLSLLTAFRAPTSFLWYISILVTEFSWLFFLFTCVLILLRFGKPKYRVAGSFIGIIATVFFLLPLIGAYRLSTAIENDFAKAFPAGINMESTKGIKRELYSRPFQLTRMITDIAAREVPFATFTYDKANQLTLHFYRAIQPGRKPCIVVIHGGSWSGGDNRQLPDLNSELAKRGYHVASINYRLAPKHLFPSPVQDVQSALAYLRSQATALSIDTTRFVLLGRSAGGQIALSAAYLLNDPGIKGVIGFYGPADMVWGYANPTNPLVLDSRKVMENYLGGSYNKVRQQYITSSPTETATSHSPPTLVIYGRNDPLVSHEHGDRLSVKLKALGVPHFVLTLPWATHAFDWTLNGPGGQLSTWTVLRFLERVIQ